MLVILCLRVCRFLVVCHPVDADWFIVLVSSQMCVLAFSFRCVFVCLSVGVSFVFAYVNGVRVRVCVCVCVCVCLCLCLSVFCLLVRLPVLSSLVSFVCTLEGLLVNWIVMSYCMYARMHVCT